MAKSVGIDLGTTNSVVAVLDDGKPFVIPLAEGSNLCPSVVGFSKNGERLVGYLAKRQAITNPERTVISIKRQMGTTHRTTIDGKSYSPEQISAMILEKLRSDAEDYLGDVISEAVITVPAYFSNAQREATKHAGEIAGISVVRIINEPTAAALAYGQDKSTEKNILVWDLGGGTFDVSILEVSGDVFEVRATSGDTRLGGDDWDERVTSYLTSEFTRVNPKIDLRTDLVAMQRLREAAEKAKIELSTVTTASINLPFLASGDDGPIHLETGLTRIQLEGMCQDLLDRMISPTESALKDAGMTPDQIERVLLVGGSTRMPAVQALIRTMFGKEPYKGINPDEAVAQGAALQAGIIRGDVTDLVLIDVTPLSLGIETQGGVFTKLIDRNSAIPTSHSQLFTTAIDNQSAVDIHVLQGERDFAVDNKALGKFQLTGIPPSPRGVPRIEVTFDIDVNGIVNVGARDVATGNLQKVTITSSVGLSRDEVSRMVVEADENRRTDSKRREEIESRNKAEQKVYFAQKLLQEGKSVVTPSILQDLITKAKQVQDALNNNDISGLRRRTDALDETIALVSKAIYESKSTFGSDAPSPVGAAAVSSSRNYPAPPPAMSAFEPEPAPDSSQELESDVPLAPVENFKDV
jgi:molecular chaperone DnaK